MSPQQFNRPDVLQDLNGSLEKLVKLLVITLISKFEWRFDAQYLLFRVAYFSSVRLADACQLMPRMPRMTTGTSAI
jgi:hypothetical protein